ncbi:MAG: response regulator transcription factor [Caulobacter sp.]|nr:response regulator transcription factor [Caulobacter sp.]
MQSQISEAQIGVLVVDDHPMLREGVVGAIQRQPDMIVVGEAGDGAEAIMLAKSLRPDVTLMDIQMPGTDGVEAIKAIRHQTPDARILVLTTYPGDVQASRAIRAGASGYVLKSSMRKDLLHMIREAHAGRPAVCAEVASEIARWSHDERLSERETEILSLVAVGHSNKQIAWRLAISIDTVKVHLKSIFAKLGAVDRTHAVTIAARRGSIAI